MTGVIVALSLAVLYYVYESGIDVHVLERRGAVTAIERGTGSDGSGANADSVESYAPGTPRD